MSALKLPLSVVAGESSAYIDDGDNCSLFSNRDENFRMYGDRDAAEEIVRRVNLHDELVEALRKARAYMNKPVNGSDWFAAMEAASAVLAKVEGR